MTESDVDMTRSHSLLLSMELRIILAPWGWELEAFLAPSLPCMGCTGYMGSWTKGWEWGSKSIQNKEELPLFCTGFMVLWQPYWDSHGFFKKGTVFSECGGSIVQLWEQRNCQGIMRVIYSMGSTCWLN